MKKNGYDAIVKAIVTIPKKERGRMIGILREDIKDSTSSEKRKKKALKLLDKVSVDFWAYRDAVGADGSNPSEEANAGFLRVAKKLEKQFDIKI